MTRPNTPSLAFIGFGEAGQAVAAGLRDAGVERISAWDILFPQAEGERLKQAGTQAGARIASSAADAVKGADMIISAVTAASSLDAAKSVKEHLTGTPFYLDINSVSPGRKRETQEYLDGAARYVDVAVLAPIHPARHQTPMLLAGENAAAIEPILQALAMKVNVAGPRTGAAAAIKMVRSVMIKGIEALTLECFLAAKRAGVVDEVARSMRNNYPTLDWQKVMDYNIERMASHGVRRAAEMDEVADTLRELGIEPLMATATATRQREMGVIGKDERVRATLENGGPEMLEAISTVKSER
jgi:3-hydroxyisobutyrate dehydrogenase-like beta-hydroxyacid dehydrogenase